MSGKPGFAFPFPRHQLREHASDFHRWRRLFRVRLRVPASGHDRRIQILILVTFIVYVSYIRH